MTIMRIEATMIPNTLEGQKFAKEYQERLRNLGAFRSWKEDSNSIYINAEYHFDLKAESEVENGN